MDDLTGNVGEAEIAALITIGQFFVIDSEKMQDGRLDVVDVVAISSRREAERICSSNNGAWF